MGNEIKNLLTNLKIEGFIEIFESKSYIKLQITSLAFCLKEKKHFSWMTIIFIDVYSYLIILLKLYINVHIYSSGQKFPDSSFHNWKNATNFVVSIRMKFISFLYFVGILFEAITAAYQRSISSIRLFIKSGDMLFHFLFNYTSQSCWNGFIRYLASYLFPNTGHLTYVGLLIPTVKHGGDNMMVWSIFSTEGVGPLVQINPIENL